MPSVLTRRLLALLVSALGVLTFASTASAALSSTPFGCRASTIRVTLGNSVVTEPYVANTPTTPCVTDSAAVENAKVPTTSSNAVTAGPAGAFTYNSFDPTGKSAPGAAAVASVEGVTIPSSSGNIYIVGPIQASASYACVNDRLVASSHSTLNVLYVAGVKQTVPDTAPTHISLGGNNYIDLNETTQTANSLTVDLVHVHLEGIADIVVGEAKVTQSLANPCAGTTGQPPSLEICPPGTKLNVVKQFCYVKNCSGGIIIVSRPFRGPSGGTVLPLCKARKKYKSPCLFGPGPKFVVVATRRGGRVEGTLYSDRILALGAYERVAGLGGNDCIDGKSLHQKLYDGNGKERMYGYKYERIAIGSGNSLVVGKGGHNTISVANGATKIFTYGGHNSINAGLGRVQIFGGPGPNRIFTPSGRARVNCGTGGHNTAFLRNRAIPFAKAHGCNRIIHLV
jgi:hypothetical protein